MRLAPLLLATAIVLGCGTSTESPKQKRKVAQKTRPPATWQVQTPEALGRLLVEAIANHDEKAAFALLPTRAELAALGKPISEEGYKKFLAKRRRGFARVVAKYKRKHPGGCKKLVFSRVVKNNPRKVGTADAIGSIDLFARCDGREIWLADPDMLIRIRSGWRLLEFS